MTLTVSNTTQSLANTLKDSYRTEGIEVQKKNEELPAKNAAK